MEKNHIQLAAFILSLGKVELQTQDYARRTALELVAGLPLTDPMVDLLIKQGACPDDLDVFESEEEYMVSNFPCNFRHTYIFYLVN